MAETGSYSYATSSATSSAMSAMSVEKPDGLVLDRDNLSPELLKILDEVDRDGDGDVDINELLMAFQEMHHARKSNKRLVRILIVGAVLFALTLGAIFALSVAAAELAKDTNIESSSSAPAVMRTKSGGSEYTSTVRTASVTPGISVGTVDDPPEDDDASRALRARAREVEGRTSEVDTADLSVLCESAETEVTDDFTFDTALVFPRPDSVENIRTNPTAPFSLSLPGQASTQIMRFRITGISSFDNNTFDSIPEETELDVTDLVVDGDAEAAARLCCDHANCAYAVGESIIEMEDDSTYVNGTAVDPPSAGELDEAASRWVMNRYGEMVEPGREHEAATERAIGARVTISTGLQRYLTGRCTRRVCYVRGLMQGSGVLQPRGVTVYSPNAAKTTYASVKPMRVRPRTLVVCPVNDGDLDLASASVSDNKIAWYENIDGVGSFGPQQVVSTAAHGVQSVIATDVDGDGDLDLASASASDNKIAWYENIDGAGSFGPQQVVSTTASYARCVVAADVDGDGDLDLASASSSDNKIAWYENIDGAGSFGPQQVVSTTASYARSVLAADVDGDGDLDLVSASASDNKIAWYENINGAGSFGPQQVVSTAAQGAVSVIAADMDGDGDLDLGSASERDDKIAWYENMDGAGSFGPQQVVSIAAGKSQSVIAADVDGDGDLDLASASASDNKIAWYENTDGAGSFGPQQW
ncbi:uncharacterized protein AMSG_12241 [Thecamonas trahens ATCC 50062]|uniref:EF-hand domain-containing protein n=1 Tax=Thecamonas trahens ATCC 50062 TaxID=461836 RepID=A0A0L0DLR7_THETB|nr:hypothetical protein AMSG_12241 [Thecamonas trahens ATCC 50062]KNC52986.1 hypothetical protein AMSG_12241 [Thecamonas trahens ATCC 50062]|eukprot:XP_013754919.1 hypothetical protein AMSG_12241 [Thecamonas trahens ATCC 50062]